MLKIDSAKNTASYVQRRWEDRVTRREIETMEL